MKGHSVCFRSEIRKIIFELFSIPLLSGALMHGFLPFFLQRNPIFYFPILSFGDKTFPKWGLLLLFSKQNFSFKSCHIEQGSKRKMVELLTLKVFL